MNKYSYLDTFLMDKKGNNYKKLIKDKFYNAYYQCVL